MRTRGMIAVATVFCAAALLPAIAANPFSSKMPKHDRVLHAINRLTFGPRPGDTEAVGRSGLKKWIDHQLHPERIRQNPMLEKKLALLDTLRMSSRELAQNFPPPQVLRLMSQGKVPYPSDPDRKAAVQKLVARYERSQGRGKAEDRPKINEFLSAAQVRTLRTGTPQEKVALISSLPADRQDDIIASLPREARVGLFSIATPELRRRMELAAGPYQVMANDLAQAKLYRAVYSTRQLEEVLVDFWYNHLNVFLDKGADRYLVTEYERDAIRPHVLGKFRDLLEATAKSPAMLFYLDNWQSVGPATQSVRRGNRAVRGLNENYGRELLELHTLGVDGGYTQKDVTEVARCFTGWTIRDPQRGGPFEFNARAHDPGEKTVFGVTIPAGGGIEDGMKVLDLLAHHPSTARFISRKLAQRFVSDNPPASLVDRMAATFTKTGGDIRAVLKTLFDSREFWSQGALRAKLKSPFEMVVSALRASGADLDYAGSLVNQVAQLGQPLYRKLEPTGYSNAGAEWMNSAGLLARMNFAIQLAGNKIPGVKVDSAQLAKNEDRAAGIVLGSPEFQKR